MTASARQPRRPGPAPAPATRPKQAGRTRCLALARRPGTGARRPLGRACPFSAAAPSAGAPAPPRP
eukprot:4082966-Lingulodinium_polyedra.AAC.1